MQNNAAQLIFFSPTKTTLKTLTAIAEGTGLDMAPPMDLTFPATEETNASEGIAIIGVPVYAGRVPALAVERLRQRAQGNGRPAILVAVYGNRAFEDALLELRDLAEELNFKPVAAGAFIGEHSFSTREMPVAPGRPESDDLATAREFGIQAMAKIKKISSMEQEPRLEVPGNYPHRNGMPPSTICPVTDDDACTLCGECARMCPAQAIRVTDTGVKTDPSGCIWCSACIRACPTGGRVWDAPKIRETNTFLYTNHAEPKQPEIFL